MKLMQIEIRVYETDEPTVLYKPYDTIQGMSLAVMPVVLGGDNLLAEMIKIALADLDRKLKAAAVEDES